MKKAGPAARFLENIELKEEAHGATRKAAKQERELEALRSQVEDIDAEGLAKGRIFLKKRWKAIGVFLLCIILTILATLVAVWSSSRNATPLLSSPDEDSAQKTLSLQMPLTAGQDGTSSLNFGVRLDGRLQDCQTTHWKRSFPDLDYALFGYDILKGYPMATGHDPGFTHPIFVADYSSGGQTSDCRYSVPKGLIVMPDVSCVTSFSSKVIKNKLEMSKSLETAAHVEGGGWGFKFSASASYKSSVSQVSSGEFIFIVSQARCRYYYSTVDFTNPPPFHPGFLSWAKRLAAPDVTHKEVIQFIKYYGTHFLSDVTFGARFVKNHKVSQTSFQEIKKKKISVEAQASYSGMFSVGGGFSMDSEQRNAVSNFQKSVETSTITVGAAPPSDGDAMTWASSVQDNPVPTKYTLSEIHNLFTERFTKQLDSSVNFTAVREKLRDASKTYCEALKSDGLVDSCDESIHLGTVLEKVDVDSAGYREPVRGKDEMVCKTLCLQEETCVAVGYSANQQCTFLNGKNDVTIQSASTGKLIIFPPRLQRAKKNFALAGVKFDESSQRRYSFNVSGTADCNKRCAHDAFCHAFVICERVDNSWCISTEGNCYLYSETGIGTVEPATNSAVQFVWRNFTQISQN